MGDLTTFIVSFFKKTKIDYVLDKDNHEMLFPCFYCFGSATMNSSNGSWKCEVCIKHGTLKNLIDMASNSLAPRNKIFNPNREIKEINEIFKKLTGVHGSELMKLHSKVEKIISYLMQCTNKDRHLK